MAVVFHISVPFEALRAAVIPTPVKLRRCYFLHRSRPHNNFLLRWGPGPCLHYVHSGHAPYHPVNDLDSRAIPRQWYFDWCYCRAIPLKAPGQWDLLLIIPSARSGYRLKQWWQTAQGDWSQQFLEIHWQIGDSLIWAISRRSQNILRVLLESWRWHSGRLFVGTKS